MGMVVRTNTMAHNANRHLGINNSTVAGSLEKLASGFRINKAADDASGLAISEKMKAQIKGLETASANCQDGISLIQTAEGALTEVHDMLNRMVELAGKSANGTIDDDVDRRALQQEMEALQSEIDRIAEGTNFNGKMLLDGSMYSGGANGVAAGVPNIRDLMLNDNAAVAEIANFTIALPTLASGETYGWQFNYDDGNGKSQTVTVEVTYKLESGVHTLTGSDGTVYNFAGTAPTADQLADTLAKELNKTSMAKDFKIENNATTNLRITSKNPGATTKVTSAVTDLTSGTGSTFGPALTRAAGTAGADAYQDYTFGASDVGKSFSIGGQKFAFVNSDAELAALDKNVTGVVLATANTFVQGDMEKMQALIEQKTGYKPTINPGNNGFHFKSNLSTKGGTGNALELQVGDTSDPFNKVYVSVQDMSTKGLGIDVASVATQDDASNALTLLKNTVGDNDFGAINIVSSVRGDLGALQNRLEHTINNLDVAAENLTAANSRIRDTDMAKEMMNYTKSNVLMQAAQAMLAQANMQPQSVLQLLQ